MSGYLGVEGVVGHSRDVMLSFVGDRGCSLGETEVVYFAFVIVQES